MQLLTCALALLLPSLAHAFSLSDVQRVTSDPSSDIVPGRYIVEFDSNAHLQSGISKRAASAHDAVYNQLKARKIAFSVKQQYSSDLFVGASLALDSDTDITALAQTAGVLNISPVHRIVVKSQALTYDASQYVTNPNLPSAQSANVSSSSSSTPATAAKVSTTTSCTGKGKKQTCTTKTVTVSSTPSATASSTPSSTAFSFLPQIQADQIHAAGNRGKGVKIAIVDSGVDYTRTPLGGCFGAGCKIAGGYDFVGDAYDGSNDPVPDSDPYENRYDHGTFVAGIIGANENEYGVTGVAPDASLYVYRALGYTGATTDDIVLAALQRAYTDGADIINLSLGAPSGWTENPLAVMASRIVASGTIVTSTANNQGQDGAFYAGYPAAGLGVINAGGVDNAIYPAQQATVSTGYGPFPYISFETFTPGTYPLYALTTDPAVAADACTIPDGTPNLAGKLVVVRRGGCALETKAKNLYYQGARQLFIVNTPDTAPLYQNFPLDFGIVSYEDGNYLLNQIAAGNNATVTFTFSPVGVPNTFTGNITSYFSSIGPTFDMYMAPSLVAPATNIVGVVPAALGNWSIQDGTSWAAPMAAGSAALYLSAKGTNLSPKTVKEALELGALSLQTSVSDATIESVAAQGSGKIQVANSINSQLSVSPAELLLNDTANFNAYQYITVKNTGNKITKYTLSNVPAATDLAYQSGGHVANSQPVPHSTAAASIWFSQSSLTLLPGQTTLVIMRFTPPSGLDATTFPIYSGYVNIAGGNAPVHIPYLGVAASMKTLPILGRDFYGYTLPTIIDSSFSVPPAGTTYTFQDGSYPTVFYRFTGGTPLMLIDLVSANITFTPTYTSKKRSSSEITLAGPKSLREMPTLAQLQAQERSLAARRIQSTGAGKARLQGLLYLWCRLTNNKGQGCPANPGSNTFNKVPILGNLYEADYSPRNTDNQDGLGANYNTFALQTATFSNGTAIPNGSYRFLMRALKITGDVTKEDDYESWLSVPFTIAQ